MTQEQIDTMEAGREMDRLIADRIFNLDTYKKWIYVDRFDHFDCFLDDARYDENGQWDYAFLQNGSFRRVPSYSTDIAAAWQVVEKIKDVFRKQKPDWDFAIVETGENHWLAGWLQYESFELSGEGKTAPLAICRAALKVVMNQ